MDARFWCGEPHSDSMYHNVRMWQLLREVQNLEQSAQELSLPPPSFFPLLFPLPPSFLLLAWELYFYIICELKKKSCCVPQFIIYCNPTGLHSGLFSSYLLLSAVLNSPSLKMREKPFEKHFITSMCMVNNNFASLPLFLAPGTPSAGEILQGQRKPKRRPLLSLRPSCCREGLGTSRTPGSGARAASPAQSRGPAALPPGPCQRSTTSRS